MVLDNLWASVAHGGPTQSPSVFVGQMGYSAAVCSRLAIGVGRPRSGGAAKKLQVSPAEPGVLGTRVCLRSEHIPFPGLPGHGDTRDEASPFVVGSVEGFGMSQIMRT